MNQAVPATEVRDIVLHAKALVFDFDGTLVDSNPIKWRAFEQCFRDFVERHEEIRTYCCSNHDATRDEKFRHVYEIILGLSYTPQIAGMLKERFASLTTRQIVEAPEIPGASRFLRGVTESNLTVLLSSTPHDILLEILTARGWRDYFAIVRGAPVDKAGWMKAFREERKLTDEEIMFFSDTPEDAEAARAAGCTFIAVGNCPASTVTHRIMDFTELLEV